MSAGQMQAITEMNLSQQDVFAAIQAQNITASSASGQSSNSGVSFGPPDGGVPSGGPPVSACRDNAEVIPTEGASISDVYTAVAMTITAQANAFTPTALALPTTTPTI